MMSGSATDRSTLTKHRYESSGTNGTKSRDMQFPDGTRLRTQHIGRVLFMFKTIFRKFGAMVEIANGIFVVNRWIIIKKNMDYGKTNRCIQNLTKSIAPSRTVYIYI